MSILIKGIEMPDSCKYCRFYSPLVGFMCIAANKKYGDDFNQFCKKRPDWCPLVEVPPHGRLIDTDSTIEVELYDDEHEEWKTKFMSVETYLGYCYNEVPTIIEAEAES